MRRAVAIYGATEETLSLVPMLEDNPSLEVAAIYDADLAAARTRAEALDPATRDRVLPRLTDDRARLLAPGVRAVIDAGTAAPFGRVFPEADGRGLQVVSPLTARLLWGYGVSSPDRKAELLQALHEVVDSVNLTVDTDELFARMLEIAMSVTGADGGSLMLLDPQRRTLFVRVAVGVERELWPKIQVALGEGIAGRAAADARPIRLRGKADQKTFRVVRERFDVESALCVPLVHQGRVLGVLNLHHSTRSDAFTDDDLAFAEHLGRLDAEIIARAQEHESLRSQAARYGAVREVQQALAGTSPLLDRLGALCAQVARRVGGGIATVYLHHPDEGELRLAATSLVGGGLGGDYRIPVGQGVDGGAAKSRAAVFLPDAAGGLAYAALPLLAGDELAGVLSVQAGPDSSAVPARTRAVEETLLEIAAAAGDAISRASREARISGRATKVAAINEAGLRMISARDPAEVARLATSSGALILGADHAVLRLQDPESRRYVIRSYYGSADGRLEEKLFRLDKAVSIEVLRRRSAAVLRDLPPHETHVRSAMAAPLRREGTVIGTLALYDKIAPDQFYAEVFNDEDLSVFARYVSYVERALANALFYEQARRHRSFDEETGLPSADYLERRVDQELARVAGRDGALALACARIENLDAIRRAAGGAPDRVVQRVAEALRAHLRDFDVLGRTGDEEFMALLPEPGPAPDERIASLARAVADDVAKDDRLNTPVRVALAFGYAVHPADGATRKELEARSRVARIRMV
ncbi:MAG TPA: GAF domain-containing protein [Myxococcota bacterium]|nr:GAF domain-containing protein [Myxococcota bacterium]